MIMAEEQMESYLIYKALIPFGIKLSYLVFSATEQTSINLQKKIPLNKKPLLVLKVHESLKTDEE